MARKAAVKTVEVVALAAFFDLEADVFRSEGEKFEVTPSRMAAINAAGQEQNGSDLVRYADTNTVEAED